VHLTAEEADAFNQHLQEHELSDLDSTVADELKKRTADAERELTVVVQAVKSLQQQAQDRHDSETRKALALQAGEAMVDRGRRTEVPGKL